MKKYSLFILSLLVLSCNMKEHDTVIQNKIAKIHVKIESAPIDSIPFFLQKTKKLFSSITKIPDSIKAKNDSFYANYFHKKNKIDSSIWYYNKIINYPQLTLQRFEEKKYYFDLAFIYKTKGDYLNSLSVLNNLEKRIVSQKDYKILAEINNQKQSIYLLLKNYNKAFEYNKKAIQYYALEKNTSKLVNSLILQSRINYRNFNNKKQAYHLLDSILKINLTKSSFKNTLKNQMYQNYGILKYYDGNYNESYINYVKALSYLRNPKSKSDSISLSNTYANISEVCIDLKKYDLAKKFMDSVEHINTINQNLTNFHLQNKLRLAFETKKNFNQVSNGLNLLSKTLNTNYEKQINNKLFALKEANKKEKELLIKNQKISLRNADLKRKQIIIFAVLCIIVLLIIQYFRLKKHRYEKERFFLQQRLFRAQMNPHFIFNVLYNIQSSILDDKEKIKKYILKFSRVLRLNLENSMQNFVLLEKELELLSKYLDLQIISNNHVFEYEIDTNDIETDLISIPPMLMQPFVENAIKHGFKNLAYKGKIVVSLTQKENVIFCKIYDNGLGLSQPKTNENQQSASTLLINKLLKKMVKQEVKIFNNPNGKGTIVEFFIPIK